MNDISDAPPIGHNGPPIVDPDVLAQSKAKVDDFAKIAGEWLALGVISSAEQAGELADYIRGAAQVHKRIDEARVAAKRPHDNAAKAVQGVFVPLLDTIARSVSKVKPMQADWLRREQARLDAEREEQRKAAEAARLAAEDAAAIATANNSISGEIEAERLREESDKLVKAAKREVRANVQSASGAGRAMALHERKKVRILDINNLYRAYRDRPEVADVLIRLAEADVRAKGWDGKAPPGTEVYEVDSAV